MQFSENFDDPVGGFARFDHGFGGEWNAGAAFGEDRSGQCDGGAATCTTANRGWHADHAMPNDACGDPMLTSRIIRLTSATQAQDGVFFPCIPGGNPQGGHLMSAVNTEGYVTVWFSPKQVFHDVDKVCFDVNSTNLGGGKWLALQFLTPDEYRTDIGPNDGGLVNGKLDLGYTTSDFAPAPNLPSSPQGDAAHGIKFFAGGFTTYGGVGPNGGYTEDTNRAPRYQRCVEDLNNGRVRITTAGPTGVRTSEGPGNIPDGDIRVVFIDDSYNPDKHCTQNSTPTSACPAPDGNGLVKANSMTSYTWHWDNIEVA